MGETKDGEKTGLIKWCCCNWRCVTAAHPGARH